MDKTEKAKQILRSLNDVDDQYIRDAISFAEPRKNTDRKPVLIRFRKQICAAAAVAACLVLTFTGIRLSDIGNSGDTSTENPDTGSPIEEVASLEEAEDSAGFDLSVPAAGESYRQTFFVIDGMIEVQYANQKAQQVYSVRKAEGDGDISGDYNIYDNEQTENVENISVTLKGNDGTWSVATWENSGFSYAVTAGDQPLTLEEMLNIVKQVQ